MRKLKITVLKAPTEVKLNSVSNGVKISWSEMTSGTGYRVYRKLKSDADWEMIAKIKGNGTTSYTDKNVKNGKTYIYTVRQVKGSTLGSYSSKGYTIKYVVPPKMVAKLSPKGIVLNWEKAVTGSGYQVQRKAEGEKSWKIISTITSLSKLTYTDTKPVYGKKNNYRIVVRETNLISNTFSLYGINPKKKMVALTYDDGPYRPVTNQILDVLEENNARATFFVVGSRVSTYKECIKREAKLGCEIGNHSYNHPNFNTLSKDKIKEQITKTGNLVFQGIGAAPIVLRAPYGNLKEKALAASLGYNIIYWSIDTLDWDYSNQSRKGQITREEAINKTVDVIKKNAASGRIILMHDIHAISIDAAAIAIDYLHSEGYRLVTVSELCDLLNRTPDETVIYTRSSIYSN